MASHIVVRLSPNAGSGPVKGVWEACLARKSAFSLPVIPQCPSAHTSLQTLLRLLRYWSASIITATNPEVTLAEVRALKGA